jgi:hypothetical protein
MRVLLTLYWNIYVGCLNVVSPTEAQSLDDTVFAAERANVTRLSGSEVMPLNSPSVSISLFVVNR